MTGRLRLLHYAEVLLRILPEEDYVLRLEALAETLPLEVAATDERGRVIVWNAALARAAGPRAGALGRPLLLALPWLAGDRNLDWAAILDDALRGGPVRTFGRHPLGPRLVRATIAPLRAGRQEVLGALLCMEDITSGAREEERRRLRWRSEVVTALGAGIAHEIRNPLNALSLNLQLLRERLDDPAALREDLTAKADAMIEELGRMDALVQHLLEVSRGGPPATEAQPLDPIVSSVVRSLEGLARHAGARVRFEAGSSRRIPLDRARIERAIHNIVRNAIEAAGCGGETGGETAPSARAARAPGQVWIFTRDDPHSTVVVVDDDGPGIPPEDRPRVFELFWTRKRGGTGLGLPLARRAVEAHGGELEVLERPGGGARFVVHLPAEGASDREGAGGWEADEGAPGAGPGPARGGTEPWGES